jgi:hypothetical protein
MLLIGAVLFPGALFFAWQQLRPTWAASFWQQLLAQQVFATGCEARCRLTAGQNSSRWPSAQMQAVCGIVPMKNAGSMTSESNLCRCCQNCFLVWRSIPHLA